MTYEIKVTRAFECPVLNTKVIIEGCYQIPKDEESKEPAIFLFAECPKANLEQEGNDKQGKICDRLPSECGCFAIYPKQIKDPYRHAR